MRRSALISLLAILAAAGTANAAPMGTATLFAESYQDPNITLACARTYNFANQVYDVFGTNVNLSTDLVEATCEGSGTTGTNQLDSQCSSYPSPSILDVAWTVSTVCLNPPGCDHISFVTDYGTNVSGTLPASLGSNVFYTIDGEVTVIGSSPTPTIPGCSISQPVIQWSGTIGFNAFQGESTSTGLDQAASFPNTTFYNPLTGQTVPVSVDINFAQVTGAGTTIVTASSNLAGEIPSNFAFAINGFHAAFLDISTTATVLPPFVICTSYDDANSDGFVDGTSPPVPEAAVSFLHGEGNPIQFVDRTSSRDAVNNVICATTDTLSPFAVLVRTNGICAAENDPCDDGDACTENDICNASLECVGGGAVSCPDDGSACTSEVCVSPSGCTSVPAPATGCNTSNDKALLLIKNDTGNDARDKVLFKWLKGSSPLGDFGDPTATSDYTLCAYDATKTLVGATAPSASTCGSNACWSFIGPTGNPKGVKYNDPARGNDGVKLVKSKADVNGKAKVLFKALGANIPSINVGAITYPVTVQVRTSDAACWEEQFTSADEKKNTGTFLKAVHREP